jgi:hypothetical protein
MPSNHELRVSAAKAEDTLDLLNHIAWTDAIKPELLRKRDLYAKQLVNSTLGMALPEGTTREMIAGRILGIDEIISLLEKILQAGARAVQVLHSMENSL